jgi:arylsulfatase
MLPIGQQLWLKELDTYIAFPPLQSPESYNLTQVMEEAKPGSWSRERLAAGPRRMA